MLSVKNVNCRKISDITFTLEDGYILALFGENGSGKSTLLQLLYGMLREESGSAVWNGNKIAENTAQCRQEIAFCSLEHCGFAEEASCTENVKLFGALYRNFSMELFLHYCKALELPQELLQKPYAELSEGEQQKLLLSFEMAKQPKLLLLDECTAVLDSDSRITLMELLQRMVAANNTSIIFATHIAEDLETAADYLLLLHDGKQVLFADCESIREQCGGLDFIMQNLRTPERILKMAGSDNTNSVSGNNGTRDAVRIDSCPALTDTGSNFDWAASDSLAQLHGNFFRALRKKNLTYTNPYRMEWITGILFLSFLYCINDTLSAAGFAVYAVATACMLLLTAQKCCKLYTSFTYLEDGALVMNSITELFVRHSINTEQVVRELQKELCPIALPASLFSFVGGAFLMRSVPATFLMLAVSWLIPLLWIKWECFLLRKQLNATNTPENRLAFHFGRMFLPGIAMVVTLVISVITVLLFSLFGSAILVTLCTRTDESILRTNYSNIGTVVLFVSCFILLSGGSYLFCEPRLKPKKYGRKILLPAGVICLFATLLVAGFRTEFREDKITSFRFFQKKEYAFSDVVSYRIFDHFNDEFHIRLTMKDGQNCSLTCGSAELSDHYNELYYDDYAWVLGILQKLPDDVEKQIEDGIFERHETEISGLDETIQIHFKELWAYVNAEN